MYAVSDAYKAAMKQPVQHFTMRGTIGDTAFTDENILSGSCSITNQCSDDTTLQIGQVYIGELDVTLLNLDLERYALKEKKITPFFGLEVSDSKYEYVPLGVYNISEAQWTESGIVIKAYDNMSLLDKSCTITSSNGKPYNLAKMACDSCGASLGTTEDEFQAFANGDVTLSLYSENDIETWRDYLAWLSQALGCFVTCDRAGRIVFRAYNQTVVDAIDASHRFSGGSFSDFETRYTGLSCVNISDKTTSYYGMDEDDGLTYNLGSNPFLQYGVSDTLEKERRAVLTALQQIDYVPFKVTMIGNPAYDLGDVLSFPGGIGDADKLFCITKYTLKYNGSYEVQGVGQDPALSSAKSKSDKSIAGLISSQTDGDMHYVLYQNADALAVSGGDEVSVLFIKFAVQKTTHVSFDAEILLTVQTMEDSSSDLVSNSDAVIKATYYLNGKEITTRHPVETWQDGKHILRLHYEIEAVEAAIHTWNVVLTVSGGSIQIDQYGVLAVINGMGLAGNGEWSGELTAEDTIENLQLTRILQGFTDSAEVHMVPITDVTAADSMSVINVASILASFTESVSTDPAVMVFSPATNADKVTTTCTVENHGWVGSGSLSQGTNLSVITNPVYGTTGITAESKNAIFYLSFDGGTTWQGYTGTEWKADLSMTESELEDVPKEAYPASDPVQVKVVLENDAMLYVLNLNGGRIES